MALITPTFTSQFEGDSHQIITGQPDCGWYNIHGYYLGSRLNRSDISANITWDDENGVTCDLVEINLAPYHDRDLDDTAISDFRYILSQYRNARHSVILRMLYDWDGKAVLTEPDTLTQVYSHIDSLAPVINEYKDVIFVCQGILLGNHAEMHGSSLMTNASMRTITGRLATDIDPDIFLAVRTPAHRRYIVKSTSTLKSENAFNGSLSSRLGLFNDGLMGSDTDLGTYGSSSMKGQKDLLAHGTRSEEIKYQDSVCLYVPNGGEAGGFSSYSDLPDAFKYLSSIHISYLNHGYSEQVINKWKNTTVAFPGTSFTTDGFTAIGMMLGYRPEVTAVDISRDGFLLSDTDIDVTITNNGFAPIYRPATATLTIRSSDGSSTTLKSSIDRREFADKGYAVLHFKTSYKELPKDSLLSLSLTSDVSGRPIILSNANASTTGITLGSLQK